ncbi:flagella synthesis protein FlgN [Leeia oryzae]|uniref:flagella synthesis protein FlgN n=1 Tax=Leeia oryzae TaxID=356662 RepID=UPI000365DD00|nr:flagellar protein FlgN [Leeia oryzae]
MTGNQKELLARLLQEQISGLQQLVSTLQQEQHMLVTHDGTGLEAISAGKSAQINALQSLSEAFRQQLCNLCGSQDIDAQKAWLASNLSDDPDWQTWNQLARQSQQLNEQNGKLIEQSLQFQARQLAVLVPQEENKLYNATGFADFKPTLTRKRDIV